MEDSTFHKFLGMWVPELIWWLIECQKIWGFQRVQPLFYFYVRSHFLGASDFDSLSTILKPTSYVTLTYFPPNFIWTVGLKSMPFKLFANIINWAFRFPYFLISSNSYGITRIHRENKALSPPNKRKSVLKHSITPLKASRVDAIAWHPSREKPIFKINQIHNNDGPTLDDDGELQSYVKVVSQSCGWTTTS